MRAIVPRGPLARVRDAASSSRRRILRAACLIGAAPMLALAPPGHAHESPEAKLQLTQREDGALQVQWVVDPGELYQRAVAPELSRMQALARFPAQPPAAQRQALLAMREALEAGTVLAAERGTRIAVRWRWPAEGDLVASLRRAAMAAVLQADGAIGPHEHAEPLVVVGHARLDPGARRLAVEVPAAVGPAIVVHVRPRQQALRDRRAVVVLD
jgi:hypothetical protein